MAYHAILLCDRYINLWGITLYERQDSVSLSLIQCDPPQVGNDLEVGGGVFGDRLAIGLVTHGVQWVVTHGVEWVVTHALLSCLSCLLSGGTTSGDTTNSEGHWLTQHRPANLGVFDSIFMPCHPLPHSATSTTLHDMHTRTPRVARTDGTLSDVVCLAVSDVVVRYVA